jgi:hypothetical protein
MNKTILTIMMMQISSPFIVPESMLPLSIDELLARIRTQYADAIHEHGIELREEYKGSITASNPTVVDDHCSARPRLIRQKEEVSLRFITNKCRAVSP